MPVRKFIFILLGCGAIAATIAGCAYAKKDVVQTATCVIADSLFYTKDIVPIMQANCYFCHSSAANSSGILLDNYNALTFYAKNGYLFNVINHTSGYNPMPENASKLSDCTIATIKKWIDTGMPQ